MKVLSKPKSKAEMSKEAMAEANVAIMAMGGMKVECDDGTVRELIKAATFVTDPIRFIE